MRERDESLLLNIKDDAELLLELIDGYDFKRFLSDERTKLAVSMLLIKIGECVNSLSKELKQENKNVEWREIISLRNIAVHNLSLRNIAVHNYDDLRMDWIWKNVTRDVPELLEQVKKILRDGEVEEGE
jgi:uncharacterized protein with HEPN domain